MKNTRSVGLEVLKGMSSREPIRTAHKLQIHSFLLAIDQQIDNLR